MVKQKTKQKREEERREPTAEEGFRKFINGIIDTFIGLFQFSYAIFKNIMNSAEKHNKEKEKK